jgi:hypothetical protein
LTGADSFNVMVSCVLVISPVRAGDFFGIQSVS